MPSAVQLASAFLSLTVLVDAWGATEPNLDEELLQRAHISTENTGLLTVLQRHAVRPGDPRIEELVSALGSPGFRQREQAAAQLIGYGEVAVSALRKGLQSTDP